MLHTLYNGSRLTCVPFVHTVWRAHWPVYHSAGFAAHFCCLLRLPVCKYTAYFSEHTVAFTYTLSSHFLVEALQVQPGYLNVVQ